MRCPSSTPSEQGYVDWLFVDKGHRSARGSTDPMADAQDETTSREHILLMQRDAELEKLEEERKKFLAVSRGMSMQGQPSFVEEDRKIRNQISGF